jgi:YgiT-type zinc finger domain-containing protein
MGRLQEKETAVRTCNVCGNTTFTGQQVDEVFRIDGKLVLVEHIPAIVCDRCGEANFTPETTEHVRQTVHSKRAPERQESLQVYSYV